MISGTVKDKGKQKRTVVLEQKIASGWRKVDKVKSSRSGAYAISVPTHWFYSSKLRTRVVRTRKFRGDTSRARRMSVVPAYVPLGSASSWRPLGRAGQPVEPVPHPHLRHQQRRATPDAATVAAGIHNTMALVGQATGIRFKARRRDHSDPPRPEVDPQGAADRVLLRHRRADQARPRPADRRPRRLRPLPGGAGPARPPGLAGHQRRCGLRPHRHRDDDGRAVPAARPCTRWATSWAWATSARSTST